MITKREAIILVLVFVMCVAVIRRAAMSYGHEHMLKRCIQKLDMATVWTIKKAGVYRVTADGPVWVEEMND